MAIAALPPEVLDAVLRATALSAPQAARLLPCVCRAFRASVARIAASAAPFATLLAVSCSESRALLLLRLRLLPPSDAGAPAAARGAELLARYDVADLGVAEAGLAQRSADPDGAAWPTYLARLGPRGAEAAHTPLLLSEYARSGLVRARERAAQRLATPQALTRPRVARRCCCAPRSRPTAPRSWRATASSRTRG